MAAPKATALTRPRRRLLYHSLWGVVSGIVLLIFWAPRAHHWVHTGLTPAGASVGSDVRVFGLLPYLQIRRDDVPLQSNSRLLIDWFTHPAGGDVHFVWSMPALLATLIGSGTIIFIAWLVAEREIRRRTPVGICDECGYDLQGLAGGARTCPECGAAVLVTQAV